MTTLIFLFISFIHFNLGLAQSIVIGNSGDEYHMDKTRDLYLRDLVQYNIDLETETAFSSNLQLINPLLVQKTIDRLTIINEQELPINKQQLALRILSLEEIHPLMDDIFLEVLNSYSWIAIDYPLHPERSDSFFFANGEPVQIANRHLNTIRIYKSAWDKMPENHKQALIFREVLYRMMKKSPSLAFGY